MFDKLKNLMELQKQANELKKEFGKMTVENTRLSGQIRVKVNGEFSITELEIDTALLKEEKKNVLISNLRDCINEAQQKVKMEIARKMKDSMGGLNV